MTQEKEGYKQAYTPTTPLFTTAAQPDDCDLLADALYDEDYALARRIILNSDMELEDLVDRTLEHIEKLQEKVNDYEQEDY